MKRDEDDSLFWALVITVMVIVILSGCTMNQGAVSMVETLRDVGCRVESVTVRPRGNFKIVTDCPESDF